MVAQTPVCKWLYRLWIAAALAWVVFVSWQAASAWPSLPLDMGGSDPATDAALQTAQIQHAAAAIGLAIVLPFVTYVLLKALCRHRVRT